jgi:hypothetical protein
MPGTEVVRYTGPDRRQADQEHRFHLRRRDAWARGLAPLWFLAVLGGLYGISSSEDRAPYYALAGVALAGTLGSTWLLSRTAFRWQFRRPYHWWNPKDHWRAHVAYLAFKVHFPVVTAWQSLLRRREAPAPIPGSRREDRAHLGGRRRGRGRRRPAPQHGMPEGG